MAKNFSGREYKLSVAGSAPGSPELVSLYTAVGLGQSLSISQSRNAMDRSSKDSGDDSTFVAGRRNVTVSGSGIFDHAIDAGYTILESAFASSSGDVWLIITPLNASDKEWYGKGKITDLSITLDDESVSTFSTTFQIDGVLTSATDGGT